jgi:hypothetical protein
MVYFIVLMCVEFFLAWFAGWLIGTIATVIIFAFPAAATLIAILASVATFVLVTTFIKEFFTVASAITFLIFAIPYFTFVNAKAWVFHLSRSIKFFFSKKSFKACDFVSQIS